MSLAGTSTAPTCAPADGSPLGPEPRKGEIQMKALSRISHVTKKKKECVFFGATSRGRISIHFISEVDAHAESYTEQTFSVYLFH